MQHTGMCKMPEFQTAHHHQILQHFSLLLFRPGDCTSSVKLLVMYLVCHSLVANSLVGCSVKASCMQFQDKY
jgi:uncharacterized membrane protein